MKTPVAYRMIEAQGAKFPGETFNICYCSYHKKYIEPITGEEATRVIGDIVVWEYKETK